MELKTRGKAALIDIIYEIHKHNLARLNYTIVTVTFTHPIQTLPQQNDK